MPPCPFTIQRQELIRVGSQLRHLPLEDNCALDDRFVAIALETQSFLRILWVRSVFFEMPTSLSSARVAESPLASPDWRQFPADRRAPNTRKPNAAGVNNFQKERILKDVPLGSTFFNFSRVYKRANSPDLIEKPSASDSHTLEKELSR